MASPSRRPGIAVIHLVRATYGVQPFRRFIRSYAAHRAGVDHELVLLCKGFDTDRLPAEWTDVLGAVPARRLFLPDTGTDISSYFDVAELLRHRHLCFVNTWSCILANEWLKRLHRHGASPNVGVVGATGAWFSLYTAALLAHRQRSRVAGETAWDESQLDVLRPHFPPFPNPYVRTNGFLIRRSLFRSLRGTGYTKVEALLFELGADSMTRQVLGRHLQALVVGRDGRGYELEVLPESRTFRSGDQDNLLVSDNRTEMYTRAVGTTRDALAWATWGEAARQGAPCRLGDVGPLELDRLPPGVRITVG